MQSLKNKRILLGVSGGVAAYKTPEIVRRIVKAGGQVKVVLTKSGEKFVTRTTLETVSGNQVHSELFPPEGSYDPIHIRLARWSDAILIAPATANIVGKAANGIADDLLSTVLLAADVSVFMTPSMNTLMYEHPSVQQNIATLKSRGINILDPASGLLASPSEGEGPGRLPEPVEIVEWLAESLDESASKFENVKILVTAGPTIEEIDPVRYISNHSSGKMGFAIAAEAAKQGAEVVLIHGLVSIPPPSKLRAIQVTSADEMFKAVKEEYPKCKVAVMAAAVADYRPIARSVEKLKKKDLLTLELVKNPDILKWMGENRKRQYLVGFALEDSENVDEAMKKLKDKKADMIVLNSTEALLSDDNKAVIISADFEESLPPMSKKKLAREILDKIASKIW